MHTTGCNDDETAFANVIKMIITRFSSRFHKIHAGNVGFKEIKVKDLYTLRFATWRESLLNVVDRAFH